MTALQLLTFLALMGLAAYFAGEAFFNALRARRTLTEVRKLRDEALRDLHRAQAALDELERERRNLGLVTTERSR